MPTLYLIPTVLADDTAAQVLPPQVPAQVAALRYFLVENARTVRRFIKQVAPVAEEAGVRIGIHPDDPPVPVLAGGPRCVFGNFERHKRHALPGADR